MSAAGLWRETEKLRLRLLLDPKPHHWLFERFELLERSVDAA
jgi:hypothetical protein